MKFKCIECDYECDARSNFDKHEKTEKHILRTKKLDDIDGKVFECSKCFAKFSHSSSLSRHKTACNNKALVQKGNDQQINLLLEQIKEYKNELFKKNEKCEQLREEKYIAIENLRKDKDAEIKKILSDKEAEIKKILSDKDAEIKRLMDRLYEEKVSEVKELKNNVNSMSTSNDKVKISAFGYVKKYYKNSPAIKNFEDAELLGEDDSKIIENAIFALRHKKLHVYVGDVLIKVYKKDDLNMQSLWSSDTNRLAYLMRTKRNEEIDWIKDDRGIKTGALLITPALNYIRSAAVNYLPKLAKEMTFENNMEKLDQQLLCVNLIKEIDNTLTSQILKYIAPSFKLNISSPTKKYIENNKDLMEAKNSDSTTIYVDQGEEEIDEGPDEKIEIIND
ncbi:MAG: zinc finger protein [Harvfovirus sp.]|uniref:Zinc finger protein n=1 Tax=Harvfovirus sp. TaxID=2487768 RepID=A0A3G5A118_9VIRU|nr:MAG: zinc finger protein [Harvfovirus sp.]